MGSDHPAKENRSWVLVNAFPEMDADGRLRQVVVTFIDVTERKRMEQERLEMDRQLQHTQKLESLGVLAGGIAHDFNNLLMSILGHADLALDELTPTSPARANIEQIETASRRAAHLCAQMLANSGRGVSLSKHLM
jgi:signal transduction histidine kinase